ncbi:MAG TPA: tyrosine-type recombinase/integrase [Planctomycetota bacterium]|nr:tyrosine-type recombinase/integrase [Planctomycetota bacterium]
MDANGNADTNRRLMPHELKALWRVAKNPRDAAILWTFYATGCRLAELVGLDCTDLHGDAEGRGILRLLNSKRRRKKADPQVNHRHSGREYRTVPMLKPAVDALRVYLAGRTEGPMFLGRSGGRIDVRSVQWIVERLSGRAGIPKISPHALRHTFATASLEAGCSLRQVQQMLGHRNTASTEVYLHETTTWMREQYEKLPLPGAG